MSSFLEYSKGYEVKENAAVSAFVAATIRQKKAFETGESNRRSWVREEVNGYYIKLGKLAKTYLVTEKNDVSDFLHRAAVAAQSEPEFQAQIEAAYGKPVEEAPVKRRGRKPKAE
jgi:hypothetical protein